ncbi:MurR/RpiR family transcriptional regulator [Falsirhodobacter sp. 20TX0035]|uniref:MurR/RpiR family transcriptional regulator n=1 Tax=Falsirhodobacter sp. 20TX0035 TaxID=3022019 RepID=UPI00232FA23F|nr:MurR/RpiR family transcriptional regulator [Falsirhodobacter sp. 20TX0035]MDB6452524.1 MurR/RpiR family transcriptional regulator [Falsirhodobacter sp. 20TX0035]
MTDLKTFIEAGWADLSATHKRVGAYVLSNPFLVATMGIEDLAQGAEVSPATITRFVRHLGLRNYAEFRAIAIRQYQDLLQPIENIGRAQQTSTAEIVEQTVRASLDNVEAMARGLSPEQLEPLVDRMVAAGQVGMLGFGSSARCMNYLFGLTEPFLRNQILLDGTGGHERMARLIGRMGPRDLILAMSLPRYSVATMEFVRLARASGVPCVALTDGLHSPLHDLCDQTFVLPAAHPVLNSSAMAGFAFMEAVASVLNARYQSTSEATAVTRLIFPYLYTDDIASSSTPAKDSQ